jgi:hypothetical protein
VGGSEGEREWYDFMIDSDTAPISSSNRGRGDQTLVSVEICLVIYR